MRKKEIFIEYFKNLKNILLYKQSRISNFNTQNSINPINEITIKNLPKLIIKNRIYPGKLNLDYIPKIVFENNLKFKKFKKINNIEFSNFFLLKTKINYKKFNLINNNNNIYLKNDILYKNNIKIINKITNLIPKVVNNVEFFNIINLFTIKNFKTIDFLVELGINS